jgi:hypothetical protein
VSSGPLHPLVDRRWMQPAVLTVCTCAALFLLAREVL